MSRFAKKYFPLLVSLISAFIVFYSIHKGSLEVGRGLPPFSMHEDPTNFWISIAGLSIFSLYAFYFFIKDSHEE